MAANELKLSSSVRHVAFDATGQYVAILRDRYIDVFKWSTFTKAWIEKPKLVHTVKYNIYF